MIRLLIRLARFLFVILVGAGVVLMSFAWSDLGSAPDEVLLARMEASPQWRDGKMRNPEPMYNDVWGSIAAFPYVNQYGSPDAPVPMISTDPALVGIPPESGLRITWLGHSTVLIDIDGVRVLTDPIFGGRASPITWLGPATWYPPPLPLSSLPEVDVVLISHDHYDHLQTDTIKALATTNARFIVPLGVAAHLQGWGVDPQRITSVDWWDPIEVGGITIHATPSRHASGRHLLDQNRTLWVGYALLGPDHRLFFSGDTGMFNGIRDIGERLGPFDVTMIEMGAYHKAWPDWHIGPEQAVLAHQWLGGEVFLPIHWGLWDLAMHGWTEPMERVLAEADRSQVAVAMPRPGESFELQKLPRTRWWPELPWQTAQEHPIISTKVDHGDWP